MKRKEKNGEKNTKRGPILNKKKGTKTEKDRGYHLLEGRVARGTGGGIMTQKKL